MFSIDSEKTPHNHSRVLGSTAKGVFRSTAGAAAAAAAAGDTNEYSEPCGSNAPNLRRNLQDKIGMQKLRPMGQYL